MPLNKRELTELLLGIIGDIGEKKNDGFVYVKREKLLLKWEACGQGKFTDHGQGKISKFLQNDLSMQIVSNDRYRLDQLLIPDLDDEQQRRLPLATREKTTDLTTSDIGTHNLITLSELKNKVYNMILTFVKRTWSSEQCDQKFRTVSLEELNKEWQKLNPNKKFKDYKHGTFKLFLIEKCHLTGSGKDDFEVNIRFIETQIQDLSKESDGSNADNSRVSVKNQLPSKSSYSPQQQIGQGGVFRPGSQSNTCIQQSGIQKPTLASNHPSEATSISDARLQCSGLSTRGTRALANDKLPESRISQSRRYYMQLLSGLFECGLKALRQLFMEIHPNWKNTPNDIRTFEQGTLQVKGKSETDKFKSGDIDKWDISLITKVLLYSKKSKEKLGSDARFQRCRGAVETISTIRNYVQGHSASGELTKSEHENQMKKLRKAVVNDLGFDEAVFDKSIEGKRIQAIKRIFTLNIDVVETIVEESTNRREM